MDKIELNFRREDFIGNEYQDNYDCAISRAIRRELKWKEFFVGGSYIKDSRYEAPTINSYSIEDYTFNGNNQGWFSHKAFEDITKAITNNLFISASVILLKDKT